jgi:glutathione synthase/RimK-type ligase-like ATP-grasp enzyme
MNAVFKIPDFPYPVCMPNSPLSSKNLLWITDPWRTLDREQDTTLRLAQEAVNLGIKTYWSASDQVLDAAPGLLKVFPFSKAEMEEPREAVFLSPSKFNQIHYRLDPPVDEHYRQLLEELAARGAKPGQILNPPSLIAFQSEKLPPPDLHHLAPQAVVILAEADAISAYFRARKWPAWVSKPMNLAQSIGVKRRENPKKLEEFLTHLENDSDHYRHPVLVQEYLPGITKGEIRMWFARGKLIAALRKYPAEGDFRVLIDHGSRIEAHHPTLREQEIALEVGNSLRDQGIALAAIDFIDGKISDYNITSPGLLVQLEKVHGGSNFAAEVIRSLF